MSTLTRKAVTFAEIEAYVVTCTQELLASYGRTVEPQAGGSAETRGVAVMSAVGFAAPGVRGAVLLLAPRDALLGLVPEGLRARLPIDRALHDVVGEFANMLAGRLKNHLLAHGLEPLLSTPTTVVGEDLVVPSSLTGMSSWHRFAGPDAHLSVRLDATFEADFSLAPADDAKGPPVHEGDMVFF